MDSTTQTILGGLIVPIGLAISLQFRKESRENRDKRQASATADAQIEVATHRLIAGMRHLINLILSRYAQCSLTYDKTPVNDISLAKRRNELLEAAVSDTALDLGYPHDWYMVG